MPVKTNDQPIVGAYGDVYSAAVGTAIPTILDTPGAGWTLLGLVSEDGVSWTPPEEETEDIKVWQSPYPKRTVTTGLSSSVTFALDEWDRESIAFALGGGEFNDVGTNVVYTPPAPGDSEMKALYVYVKDGDVKMGIYFAKGRVISRDDSVFKPDEAALLNVEFGLLVEEGRDPYNLVFETATFPPAGGTVAATGATEVVGAAGTWVPANATPPANLAAMSTVTASPLTLWSTDSYMALGDASHCHWDSTAWVTGDAP
jgi:hypothetical protein